MHCDVRASYSRSHADAAPPIWSPEHSLSGDDAKGVDSLFILPLRIIPLKTEALAKSRLLKNSSLIGVVELYRDRGTGSGQIAVHDLPVHFHWKDGAAPPDFGLLQTLALLPSYD